MIGLAKKWIPYNYLQQEICEGGFLVDPLHWVEWLRF